MGKKKKEPTTADPKEEQVLTIGEVGDAPKIVTDFEAMTCHVLDGGYETSRTFSPTELEALCCRAAELSINWQKASCYEWMEDLDIPYPVAVAIMDKLEKRGIVAPIKYVDGVPTDPGPRKVLSKSQTPLSLPSPSEPHHKSPDGNAKSAQHG